MDNNKLESTHFEHTTQEDCNATIEKLVIEHGKFVRSFIAKRLWDDQSIDDIYQSTLLEALKSFHNFRNESQPRTWLCGIAYNVIRNHIRSMHVIDCENLQILETEDVDAERSMIGDDPAVIHQRDAFQKRVNDITNSLPAVVKQTFSLVVDSGRSYEQVAILSNVPIGTVRSRIARARRELKARCH